MVREACRYRTRECVVLLAQWLSEEPKSPLVKVLSDRARRRPPSGEPIDEHLIQNLAILFEAQRVEAEPGTSLAIAEQATELFIDYFHPAAPFARASLHALWTQCAEEKELAERCARARAAIEQRIGSLAHEGDAASGTVSAAP